MPIVQMPDGAMVDMPENPTPEQLAALKEIQSPNPWREAGRVADKSLRGGLAATPGIIGDTVLSAVKNLHKGVDSLGMQSTPLIPGLQALQILSGIGKTQPVQNSQFGDVTKNIETAGGLLPPKSQPVTRGGQATANILEPAVATVAGGGTGKFWDKLLIGLAGGAGGEGAASLLGDNPLTRLAGSILGGGAAGVAKSIKSNSDDIIRDATQHLTPSDWRRARVLEATMEANDLPHLKSQLLGPRSTLDDTISVAGTHPSVRPRLVTRTENVGEKSRQAYERWNARNLPVNASERPETLHDVQSVAENVIESFKGKARAAYQGKMPPVGSAYPKEYVEKIHEALVDLAKTKYGETTDSGKYVMGIARKLVAGEKVDTSKVPKAALEWAQLSGDDVGSLAGATKTKEFVTDQHHLNNIIKELNLKSTKGDYSGEAIDDVKTMLKDLTPEFAPAREAMRDVYAKTVNPAQQGLTGQLAQMGGGLRPDKSTAKATAIGMVFSKDYPQPQAIHELAKNIGGEKVGLLLREHLARSMESATSLSSKVSDQVQGPYKFVESVAGTNAQRRNLEAALMETAKAEGANPAAVRNGFYKLMRAFESTKDLKLPESVDRAVLAQQSGKSLAAFAVAPNSRIGRSIWERATAKTYNQIADIVLSKDGLAKLEAIAKSERPETARQFVLSVMTSTAAGEQKAD